MDMKKGGGYEFTNAVYGTPQHAAAGGNVVAVANTDPNLVVGGGKKRCTRRRRKGSKKTAKRRSGGSLLNKFALPAVLMTLNHVVKQKPSLRATRYGSRKNVGGRRHHRGGSRHHHHHKGGINTNRYNIVPK
jgi:hypothetical protein